MKIRFGSDDDLPLGKTLNILDMIIVTASVYEKNGKYYPHIFLHKCFYELQKWYNMKELMFQKELTFTKQIHQKSVCFVIIGILKFWL